MNRQPFYRRSGVVKTVGILSLALVIAGSMAACGQNATEPAPAPETGGGTTTTVDAQAVYKQSCLGCHGDQLQGAVGPNLQKVGAEMTPDQIGAVIGNGRGGMPAFKGQLKDDEIAALSDWLAAKK